MMSILSAAHHNGRSRELESLDEEPARVARQQVSYGYDSLGGTVVWMRRLDG